MTSINVCPSTIEAPNEPTSVKPLHSDDHSKSTNSTQISKSDPNPSSPTTSVKSIEVGNLVITLKKDPLKALDSAILETSNTFYDDRLYQSASHTQNPQVSAWSNPLPKPRQALAYKDLSRVKSFHPTPTQYSSIQSNQLSTPYFKTQSNHQQSTQNIHHTSYHHESYSGLPRNNYRSYPQQNIDHQLYQRHSNTQNLHTRHTHQPRSQLPVHSSYKPNRTKENVAPQGYRIDQMPRNRIMKTSNTLHSEVSSSLVKLLPEEIKLKIGMPPLKPQSAYRLFVQDKYSELKKANPDLKHYEISKKANDLWLYGTSGLDKEAYEHKYEECVREYRIQCDIYKKNKAKILAEYNASKNEQKNITEDGCKEQKLKFRTAYKLFKIDYVQHVKEKYPDLGFKERADILKNIWKGLSPHSKFLYVKRSRLDKKRAMLEKTVETILQVQKEKDSNIKPKATSTTGQQESKVGDGAYKTEEEKAENSQGATGLNVNLNYNQTVGNQLDCDDDPDDEDYEPDEEELESEEDEIDEEIEEGEVVLENGEKIEIQPVKGLEDMRGN